eukprot:13070618-Heterocapsa_arctica.AAC.1
MRSTDPNPVTCNADAASTSLVWLYGDALAPEGDYCKLCWNTWRWGGFKETHSSLRIYQTKAAENNMLSKELCAARKVLLEQ